MPSTLARRLRSLTGATALLLAPAVAHALPGSIGGCGGTPFFLCLSVSDFAIGTASNGLATNQLRLTLKNQSSAVYAPATFTTFLIGGIGSAYDVTALAASSGAYTQTSNVDHRNDDNGFTGAGWNGSPQPNFIGFDNAGNTGLATGQSVTLTFSFNHSIASTDFLTPAGDAFRSSLQFAVHAQGASAAVGALCGGTSSKAVFDATGRAVSASSGANAATGCALGSVTGVGSSVVPEPGTLALLGTGIFGVGAVAVRRRRGLLRDIPRD